MCKKQPYYRELNTFYHYEFELPFRIIMYINPISNRKAKQVLLKLLG